MLAWLFAVAVATAVGITAVSAIGSGIVGSGPQPLSQSEVDAQLAAVPRTSDVPPAGSPGTSPGVPPSTAAEVPADPSKVFGVRGGTIIARCAPGGVEVLSAAPAQGYQVSSERAVDDHPKVRFTAGKAEVEVRFRCVGGVPRPDIRFKD